MWWSNQQESTQTDTNISHSLHGDSEQSDSRTHENTHNNIDVDGNKTLAAPYLSEVLVCRLCSSPNPDCSSLLSPSLKPQLACLPVHIHPSDPPSLPPLICPDCLTKLKHCHQFFCQVYSAHTKLMEGQEMDRFFKQDMSLIIGETKDVKDEPEEICEQKLEEVPKGSFSDNEEAEQIGHHWMSENKVLSNTAVKNSHKSIKTEAMSERKEMKKSNSKANKLRVFSLPSLTTCSLCGSSSSSHQANLEHWRQTHSGEEVLYSCREVQADQCNYSTKDLAEMRNHLREHLFQQGKNGQCEICAKYFPKNRLKTHIKIVHEAVKNHECKTCGKSFKTNKMLQAHELVHAPDDVRYQFSCHICGRRFTQRGNLDTHLKNHLGLKEYKCDSCGKDFITSSGLKSHMLTHTGEKPYQCESCDAKFTSSSQLKNHVMVKHLNVYRYQCTYCPVKYNRLELLKNHEMSHTGETPFKCPVCGKGFRRKDKLRIHEVLHGSDEDKYRYPCEVCGKRFTQSNNLKTHMKSHHSESVVPSSVARANYSMTSSSFLPQTWAQP